MCYFKQKTAYEMRINDWSSDVCSSDLSAARLTLFVRMIASNTVKCMNESIRSPYLVLLPTVVPWVARAVRSRQTYSFFGWRIFAKSRGARDGGVVFRGSIPPTPYCETVGGEVHERKSWRAIVDTNHLSSLHQITICTDRKTVV